MARQTALNREKEKVAELKGTVEGLKTTINIQKDSLVRKDADFTEKQQELNRKIEELARQNRIIKDLEDDLDNSLDKKTAEFFMDKIIVIVEKMVDELDC